MKNTNNGKERVIIYTLTNQLTAETIISPNDVYELALPDSYVFEENDDIITLFDEENGSGAISIRSYQIPNNYAFDIEEELEDFPKSINSTINCKALQVERNEYAYSEFTSQGKFWKIYIFFGNHNAVFASYNCSEEDKKMR